MKASPELYDWQKSHATRLLKSLYAHGYAKDGSDTGTGKTYIALHVAKYLRLTPFVVCPKAVVPSWKEAMEAFGFKVPFAHSYDKIRRGGTEFYNGRVWTLKRSKVLLIFDEDHRCKSSKSKNAKLMLHAKTGGMQVLSLGATSCTNPTEMRALGYLLDMHDDRGWYKWCLKNGCKRGLFGGLVFNNSKTVLKRLHDHIYKLGRGSRIKIGDLPDGAFPKGVITVDGYDIPNTGEIKLIYDDLRASLLDLHSRMESDDDSAIVAQLRARQQVETLKIPLLEELARDGYDSGNSVVLFVNFRDTVETLLKRLAGLCEISLIHGGQDGHERDKEVKKFQSDKSRICICTVQAGGTGLSLHDVNGDYPRLSLISPNFSAIDFKQTLGRIHRAGAKSPAVQKVIFANGTVEMRVCNAVRSKLRNIDLINDDEMNPIL